MEANGHHIARQLHEKPQLAEDHVSDFIFRAADLFVLGYGNIADIQIIVRANIGISSRRVCRVDYACWTEQIQQCSQGRFTTVVGCG
jgi:hypothetical protein